MEEIKKQTNGSVTFQLTVPWSQIQDTYHQLLQQASQQLEIKGFRKGKAPLSLVEQHLDTDKLYGRALEKLLPSIYSKFIQKHNLKPLTEPKITPIKTKPNQPWTFKVEIAERPQIQLGDYRSYLSKILHSQSKSTKSKSSSTTKTKNKNQKENITREKKLQLIFDALLKNAKVELSDLLVEAEYKSALSRLINQLTPLKISLEDYAKSLKKSVKELLEEYKKAARDNLRLEFILSELIKIEKPSVSEAEIDKLKPQPQERNYARYVLQKQKLIDKLLEL